MKTSKLELSAHIILIVSIAGMIFTLLHSLMMLTSIRGWKGVIEAIMLHTGIFTFFTLLFCIALLLYALTMAKHKLE